MKTLRNKYVILAMIGIIGSIAIPAYAESEYSLLAKITELENTQLETENELLKLEIIKLQNSACNFLEFTNDDAILRLELESLSYDLGNTAEIKKIIDSIKKDQQLKQKMFNDFIC